jgi:hypothetical protein
MTAHSDSLRIALGTLLAFMAFGAMGGGVYGLMGASGVPIEWLKGSPFRSYFIPSLFLFTGVGGICAVAALAMFSAHRLSRSYAYGAGVLLIAWIAVQVLVIGYVSWLQPAVTVYGLIILLLTRRLVDKVTGY